MLNGEIESFIDNLLVRIHLTIETILVYWMYLFADNAEAHREKEGGLFLTGGVLLRRILHFEPSLDALSLRPTS